MGKPKWVRHWGELHVQPTYWVVAGSCSWDRKGSSYHSSNYYKYTIPLYFIVFTAALFSWKSWSHWRVVFTLMEQLVSCASQAPACVYYTFKLKLIIHNALEQYSRLLLIMLHYQPLCYINLKFPFVRCLWTLHLSNSSTT